MFYKQIKNVLFIFFWFTCLQALGYSGDAYFARKTTQDMPSTRANTLSDDADDIQRQLDNEARDRVKFGRPQTIWILHYPKNHGIREVTTTEAMKLPRDHEFLNKIRHKCQGTKFNRIVIDEDFGLELMSSKPKDSWKYRDQLKWHVSHPSCGGRSQSPVNLPFNGMIHIKASRQMLFSNYNEKPKAMRLVHSGETVSLIGDWGTGSDRPFVYGGAAHSRRYVFHSMAIRRPSEHTVGGLYYPMESQAIHVSVEYPNLEEAIRAAPRHSDENHKGLEELVQSIIKGSGSVNLEPLPLEVFSPPLKEYAAYHGSLTTPPCSEAVLWLVRARALPMTRNLVEILENKIYKELGQGYNRLVQPLNDRIIYYFT